MAGFLPLSVTFILDFYCFLRFRLMEFSRFFECVFWWVFLLSVDEWAGWVVLLDFRDFVTIFFSIGLFGENSSWGDWEAKKPRNSKKKFKFSVPEILKFFIKPAIKFPQKISTKPIYYKSKFFALIFLFKF